MSARAVAAVRDWDSRLPDDAIWVACSHGDVIKAILADALGLHLDQFQRIVVDPCSVSVVRYTATRPYVLRSNDVGSRPVGVRPAQEAPPPPAARRRRHGRRRRRRRQRLIPSVDWKRIMPRQFFVFDRPSRFVAGTVGEPGDRTFFLQATDGTRVVSVALEKQQVAVLADRLEQLLDEVVAAHRHALPAVRHRHRRARAADRRGVPRQRDGAGLGRRGRRWS